MRRPKSCRELIKHLTWSYRQFARRYNCPANKTMFFRARFFFFSPLNVRRVPSRILHHRAISECKHYLYIYARVCTFTSIRIWMNEKRYSPSDISMKAFRVARFSARHTAESIGNLWKRLYRKRKKERERENRRVLLQRQCALSAYRYESKQALNNRFRDVEDILPTCCSQSYIRVNFRCYSTRKVHLARRASQLKSAL